MAGLFVTRAVTAPRIQIGYSFFAHSAFGAAGSLAALLMWLYFSALVLLFGAEFAASRDRTRRAARDQRRKERQRAGPVRPAAGKTLR